MVRSVSISFALRVGGRGSGSRGPGHGIRQMITLNLELHGTALLGWVRGGNRVGSRGIYSVSERGTGYDKRCLPGPAHRAYLVLFFSYLQNSHSHRYGGFWGESGFPQFSGPFLPTGDVRRKGRRHPCCGRGLAVPGLATGCPPVIRMSSTMLSTLASRS